MTHPYDILHEALENCDVGNEFTLTRARYEADKEAFDILTERKFIYCVKPLEGMKSIMRVTDAGLTAFDMPNAFFTDLDLAQRYDWGDEPLNKYFRNDETGALANVNPDNGIIMKSVEGWHEITEEQYLDYVNQAAFDAAFRDSVDGDPVDGYVTKDSGKRVEFVTGSRRDTSEGKTRVDLIWEGFLFRLGALLVRGLKKYGKGNWKKGQPISRSYESALRHLLAWKAGDKDEDHLAAVAFNIMSIMFVVEQVNKDNLPLRLMKEYENEEDEENDRDGWFFDCADKPDETYEIPF